MNHSYRLIWSHRNHCFVAVGEHARRCGKSVSGAGLVIAAALAAAISPTAPASAAPTGGEVKLGTGSIAQLKSGNTLLTNTLITQTSSRLAIDWKSFSSATGEIIEFRQPDASSIVLNRVIGGGRSELMGSLKANGQVFVINPNGVLFGESASVNVGGLLASTLNMTNASFLADSKLLEGGSIGAVVNKGTLTTDSPGGYIVLAGPRVINENAINAVKGKVLMAAGDKVTLKLDNTGLTSYTIDRGSLDALVENSGDKPRIAANEVILTASAATDIGRAVINHAGIIEANSLQGKPGQIQLLGTGETDIAVNGSLVASSFENKPGLVETNAARVNIREKALINGVTPNENLLKDTWTNKSTDFVIAKGKGPQTSSSIGAEVLSANLESGNQTLTAPNLDTGSGDLYVNAKVGWNAINKLTLKSSRNIYINDNIDAVKGSLTFEHGQGVIDGKGHDYFINNGAQINLSKGFNFSVVKLKAKDFPPESYYVITDLGEPNKVTGQDLQSISNTTLYYVLGKDIDASVTQTWNGGAGFRPISQFYGKLDGFGHAIKNLHINNAGANSVGLFDILAATNQGNFVSTGRVQNLTLENASVTKTGVSNDTTGVGALAGTNNGEIFNVHATMSVTSFSNNTGGLVGVNNNEIRSSSAVGVVTLQGNNNSEATGGLVGKQISTKTVDLKKTIGGTIIDSYAAVDVIGNRSVGGLVGLMKQSSDGLGNPEVTGSYAGVIAVSPDKSRGSVSGKENVGGLVGFLELGGIFDSYAAVPVKGTGGDAIGGLVGFLQGVVQRTYATGSVSPGSAKPATVGGLIGVNNSPSPDKSVLSSFWNRETTGQDSSQGSDNANGLTTVQMRNLSTFKEWGDKIDAEGGTGKTWRIYDGQTSPLLRSFLVTKSVEAKSVTYNNAIQTGCTGTPCDSASGNTTFSAASGRNVGTYTPYDSQQGYDIRGGKLTITPFLLTPTTDPLEKVYDGTDVAPGSQLQIQRQRQGTDNVIANYKSAAYDNKNVGNNKTVTFSGITLEGGDEIANYEIASAFSFNNGKITPYLLTPKATAAPEKTYDGSANVLQTNLLSVTPLGSDAFTLSYTAQYDNKNASIDAKRVDFSDMKLVAANPDTLASNYEIAKTFSINTGRISKRTLSLSDTKIADKIYDGTIAATVANIGTLKDVVVSDDVNVTVTAAFADKNVGQNKTVAINKFSLTGADAANYVVNSTQTASATIRPRPLAVRTKGVDKIYDGNTNATVTLGDNRIEGDKLDLRYAKASFADSNVGSNKTVTVAGIAAVGADAGNYVANTNAVTTASVSKAPLTVTANPDSKAFDGKAYRGGNGVTYAGFVAGENSGVLVGQPSYGGNSQGAVNIGSYRIAPGGYASQNYAIVYVDGKLTIQQPPLEPVYQAAGTEVAATAAAMSDAATDAHSTRLLSQQATLQVAGCGTRLPEQLLEIAADCNEGGASANGADSVMPALGL